MSQQITRLLMWGTICLHPGWGHDSQAQTRHPDHPIPDSVHRGQRIESQPAIREHPAGLSLASYVTAHQVERLAADPDERTRAEVAIRRMRITKLYLEVYRSGLVVPPEHLVAVRDWIQARGLDVAGGIATVPGGDFGVRQEGPLGWFNWQHKKTQQDLERVMRGTAGLFDTFIVDDFLCTGDVSAQSRTAKGDRSWGEYRRALLTELAQSLFVKPAKEVHPDITMIVKYPQWYDRFHLFGYDTATLPTLFDQVWVGTETRGRTTQRFGFVQPYEGFVNYRWLAGISGDKIGGAWFDHGDCGDHDFLDQAYMSVLAGARELVIFNFGNLLAGHPDHPRLRAQYDRLVRLATFVRQHPVTGIPAYKPPNSDPGGDMYIMDFLGMLGIPIIPVHTFPEQASHIFLPAQAAADPDLLGHIQRARQRGAHMVVTTGLLLASAHRDELLRMLDIHSPIESQPARATLVHFSPQAQNDSTTEVIVDIEAPIEASTGPQDLVCSVNGKRVVLLRTVRNTAPGSMTLLNTHTFNQADFDAVGEVLLCPRRLGLLDLPESSLSLLRRAFSGPGSTEHDLMDLHDPNLPTLAGPGGVTFHPFASDKTPCFVQNFNAYAVDVVVTMAAPPGTAGPFQDLLADRPIRSRVSGTRVELAFRIPPRDRVWLQSID